MKTVEQPTSSKEDSDGQQPTVVTLEDDHDGIVEKEEEEEEEEEIDVDEWISKEKEKYKAAAPTIVKIPAGDNNNSNNVALGKQAFQADIEGLHYKTKINYGNNNTSSPHPLPRRDDGMEQVNVNDEVQPLPPTRRTTTNRGDHDTTIIEPGAHAVDGQYYPASLRRRVPAVVLPSTRNDLEEGEVVVEEEAIHEGVLVTGNEETAAAENHNVVGEVLDGTIVPETRTNTKRTQSWSLLICLFVAGLVGVVLGITLSSGNNNNNNNNNKGASEEAIPEQHNISVSSEQDISEDEEEEEVVTPPSKIYPPFHDDLPVAVTKFLHDADHPYYKANVWMWEDPHLSNYSFDRQRQRFHLVSWYHYLNGDNWFRNDDWLSYNVSECDWFSQRGEEYNQWDDYPVCNEDNIMLKLNLNSNNLSGEQPLTTPDLLPWLRTWDLGNNQIYGTASLPVHMQDLEVFLDYDNKFGGRLLAPDVFRAHKMRICRMDGNDFDGSGYQALFLLMPALEYFSCGGNRFGGDLTPNYSTCKNMTHWLGEDNVFTGVLPTEFGLLTHMQELDISGNIGMDGNLPSELGQWTSLTRLDLLGTSITGPVPAPLCDRVRQGSLDLIANCSLLECCQ